MSDNNGSTIDELLNQLDDAPVATNNGPVVDEQGPPVEELKPSDVRTLAEQPRPTVEPELPPPQLSLDIAKISEQLETTTTEVLQACRNDRQETQDVIDQLKGAANQFLNGSGQNPGNPGALPRGIIDNLVKALEVKAGINQTAVKMIEANGKLIAAIRPSTVIQNNMNVGTQDEDLKSILEEPMQEGLDDI